MSEIKIKSITRLDGEEDDDEIFTIQVKNRLWNY